MSIFSRIKTIFSSVANDALDKMENPVSVARQTLRELDKEITDAKGTFFSLQGSLGVIKDKKSDAEKQLVKRQAQLDSLRSHEDAEAFVGIIGEVENEIARLASDVDFYTTQEADLTNTINIMNEQLAQTGRMREQVAQRLNRMVAEQTTANALGKASDVTIKMDKGNVQSEFGRLEEKVRQDYHTAKAKSSFALNTSSQSLDDRVSSALRETARA